MLDLRCHVLDHSINSSYFLLFLFTTVIYYVNLYGSQFALNFEVMLGVHYVYQEKYCPITPIVWGTNPFNSFGYSSI